MAFTNLLRRVKTLALDANLGIDVVEGLRTEDLPTPCISVHLESAENFSNLLTDVFRTNITVKYEEHYGDSTSEEVSDNFKKLLDEFLVDKLVETINVAGVHVFEAKVDDILTDVQNDLFVSQFTLALIAERDS